MSSDKPIGMRFQKRDGKILSAIYDNGGILARRHLKELFWPNASLRAAQKRLSKLCSNSYLDRPTRRHWRTKPIPESIYWLGWKGAIWISKQRGIDVDPPPTASDHNLRTLKATLRRQGVYWLSEPGWSKLEHDLRVTDFRFWIERSLNEFPSLTLEEWIPEREFRSNMDVVEFKIEGKDGEVKKKTRGVCPDGYFLVSNVELKRRGKLHKMRLLLEIDMGTHPIRSRFGRQKAAPYAAYIKSPEYETRFSVKTGRWLVVTTGETRMENLMDQTGKVVGDDSKYFLFTIFNHLGNCNAFTSPIWLQEGLSEPRSLID